MLCYVRRAVTGGSLEAVTELIESSPSLPKLTAWVAVRADPCPLFNLCNKSEVLKCYGYRDQIQLPEVWLKHKTGTNNDLANHR